MTDSTHAPDYWALLEEITEYRGRLIHLANAVYTLIDADSRQAGGEWPSALLEDGPAATEEAGDWLAPVIPLRAGNG
jgi:hypothetical protein